jgi:pimeloyl-ACP methyl ester carboxylesterase
MKRIGRLAAVSMLAGVLMAAAGPTPSFAESRAHVYLLRGLMNIFSLGMDTLASKLQAHGVYATVHNHSEWQALADRAAAAYRAGTEGPIILIGHSLGADAVMQMAAYLGTKGVPVALVVPFDGTGSYAATANVGRVLNLTQRDYAYMRRGPNFHGTLANVDVRDPGVDHINIDKSAALHARVVSEVLAVIGHHPSEPTAAHNHNGSKVEGAQDGATKPSQAPAKPRDGAMNTIDRPSSSADGGAPVVASPEHAAGVPSGAE